MVRDEEQSIDPHAVTRAGTGGASGAARPKEEAPGGGELPAGTYLGKFRVIAPLGAGGMGVVYEAEDEVLDRRVAVKLMRPEVANSAGTERLLREARAAARLSHPNVVPVYEVGASPHGPFIAMERIDGPSLRAWIAEAPRSWRETLEAFCDAGRGLAAAHAAGLVHRDFKPDNAFIGSDGRVRVGDFGLVAAVGAAGAAGGGEPARTLEPDTLQRAGSASGTPLYMAPEQHRGESADARGDQFSFCLALYEALYGQHPFPVESVAELVAAYDQERAPARPPSSEVPSRVYELLAR
ncbi:MAG TPA: serine/threonine-protein kinase, partial [Kofleriaceae bacterium]|nr:serine/threonine-protein kinase [Kofleriaceae bacterium]